jgi:hypothetical protein
MKKTVCTLLLFVAGIGATFGQSKIWKPYDINVDTSWSIRFLSAVDTNIVWAITGDIHATQGFSSTFVRTTNGGLSFRQGSVFNGSTTYNISNISAVDSSIAFVAASDFAADGSSGKIMKTIDGGLTWKLASDSSTMFLGSANYPDFVHFWDKNNGLALGDPNGNTGGGTTNEFEIYRTNNGGASWTRVADANIPNPNKGEYGIQNSYTSLGKRIWYGTTDGRVYSSLDSGKTWAVGSANPGILGQVAVLAFRDSLNGLIMGISTTTGTAIDVISKTIDGGLTWTLTTVDPVKTGMSNICVVPGRNAYMSVGGTHSNGTTFYLPYVTSVTYDDATTWNLLDSGSTQPFFMLQAVMFDSVHGWAGSISNTTLPLGKNGMDKYRGPKITFACPVNIAATKTIICLGDSTTLTASGGSTKYTWTSPAVSKSAITVHPLTSTVYTVTGTLGTCSTIQTQSITVNQVPNPTVTVNANDTVCTGGTTIITAGSNATSYTWTPKTGLTAPTNTTVVWATPATTTIYTLIAADANGCYTTVSRTVTVLSTPTPTLTVNSPSICASNTVTINASGYTTYTWSPASGLSATSGSSVVASPTTTSTYTLLAVSGACKTAAKPKVTVVTTNVSVSSPTTCANGTVTLVAGGPAPINYVWSPATGLSATSGSSVSATVSSTPSTTVHYTVTGTNTGSGCSGTAISTITVGTCFAGIAEVSNPNQVEMYPNPSSGLVNITMNELDAGTVLTVTDMIGKEVFKTPLHDASLSLDLSGLQEGMYIITIGGGKAAYIQKLILQH